MSTVSEKSVTETYLVGKRDFNSFFVTICRHGDAPVRQEGFKTVEQARAWIRERNQRSERQAALAPPHMS